MAHAALRASRRRSTSAIPTFIRTTPGGRCSEQLRRDDPVHYCEASPFGPYWSVTRYDDIFAVELDHENYSSSSELGGIQVADQPKGRSSPTFIRDGPARPHGPTTHRRADRGAVQPRQFRAADPQADLGRAGRAAAQRDL